MKRMTILLSAATLALVPLASNAAKKERSDSNPYVQPVAYDCACDVMNDYPYDIDQPELTGVLYDCTVSWDDVISAGAEEPDKAAYGASFEVEVPEEGDEDAQVLNSDIDPEKIGLEWSDICTEAGVCTVLKGQAPFILTDFTGDPLGVTVEARVKAFETGSMGKVPRNFEKSRPLPVRDIYLPRGMDSFSQALNKRADMNGPFPGD